MSRKVAYMSRRIGNGLTGMMIGAFVGILFGAFTGSTDAVGASGALFGFIGLVVAVTAPVRND